MSERRALLLTDVVDSTLLAERLGDAAAAELGAAHDRVARDLLRAWRGREIDKTDGMLMLFDSAADAVGCAIAYHAALGALPVPLQARAGLHVGPVILRTNPPDDVAHGAKPLEVEGIAKPIAARVMSLAVGGQTLLTAEAHAALGEVPWRVQSHGFWRIKGIAEPVELFEAGDERAPFMPPPDSSKVYSVVRDGELWLPRRELRHNLPVERDVFVGRRDELAALARLFDGGARLVSVLGIGGSGKTRLALRYARNWLGNFPGGAWFCDLAPARHLDGVLHAVARGLDVPLGAEDPLQQIGHAIAGHGRCLVVLDNFEQVSRLAAQTLGRWLDRAAQASFLVTSREVLGLPGEESLALAPLAPPDATALFMRRAASARRDFRPRPEDQAAVPTLVKLLDGLPLAIELAAARVRVMSPKALLARMDQRFKLLAAVGTRQDRQATLRATFDWSWELMSEAEKAALAQLSVFEGGMTLHAVEAVLDFSGCADAPSAVDVLQSLVQKSFVQQVADERFELLVSVQEYCAERLRAQGEAGGDGDATRAAHMRHARYFRSLVGVDPGADLDNMMAACRRAVLRGHAELAAELLEGAGVGLMLRGPYQAAVELANEVLNLAQLPADARARAHWVAGHALHHTGHEAQALVQLEAACALSRECAHPLGEARALRILAIADTESGEAERARSRFHAALQIAQRLADAGLQSDVHNSLGHLEEDLGHFDAARACYESALRSARQMGDRQRESAALGSLAVLSAHRGRMDEAVGLHEAALAAAREAGNRRLQGLTLCNLGLCHQLLGQALQAQRHLEQALAIARGTGNAYLECNVLCNLGITAESLQQPDAAGRQYEAAAALAHALGDRHSEGQFLGYLGLLQARQSRHAEARRSLEAGQALLESVLDRTGFGVLLCSRAEAEHLAGDAAAARGALDAAQAIFSDTGAGGESEFGVALARVGTLLSMKTA